MKSCSVSDGLAIFKALGSPVRVQILRLIQEREGLNIKQIAQNLKIPVTTLSPHLNLLAEAGLIEFRDESLSHGTQKRCYFIKDWDQLLVNMALYGPDLQTYSAEIGVGHFSDFSVTPTCGMATSTSFGTVGSATVFHTPRQPPGKDRLVHHRISGVYTAQFHP